MNNKLIKTLALASSVIVSANVNSIGIDSIIKVAENNKTTFTISNNDGYRQFVTVGVSDVSVVDGQLKVIPYTKENIADWTLEVRPARLVVSDGQSKKFSARYTGVTNQDYDKIYQLTVAPSPYYEEGEKAPQSVQMAVGFAPYLIVPAKIDQPMKFDIDYKKGLLQITNKGKSYLHVTIDGCEESATGKERNKCVKTSYALTDRELKITIDESMQDSLKLTLKTNNNTYREQFTISPSETRSK